MSENYKQLKKNYKELNENYTSMKKKVEIMKKSQTEMKNYRAETKNTLEGIISRLEEAEGLTSELEYTVEKNNHSEQKLGVKAEVEVKGALG